MFPKTYANNPTVKITTKVAKAVSNRVSELVPIYNKIFF